jgi:drug/metabolite transporter (DMT)-like permease
VVISFTGVIFIILGDGFAGDFWVGDVLVTFSALCCSCYEVFLAHKFSHKFDIRIILLMNGLFSTLLAPAFLYLFNYTGFETSELPPL